MDPTPFQPRAGGTFIVANATSASAPAALGSNSSQVVLYNSSATATAFFRCQSVFNSTDAGSNAVVPTTVSAPAVGDFPVPPLTQIRITVSEGHKKFSVIATAADGNLYITPGQGN